MHDEEKKRSETLESKRFPFFLCMKKREKEMRSRKERSRANKHDDV